ncbi:NAD/NADP octopine/nopaline dehydrogenase family protein [Microbacterium sp. No. 7]|uniref:NAD/NADP octopine/nopaline dehydrogenase family protein n=1 Tax=Microbacterium sp. No. 7 TaxID=1714373 RepID=UPI0006D11CC7|nr:NAD/NADP octopine/nopaline dehydrogenase family protein [Microbacterium sp. No. 7]ALJ21119.1 hypothetical protein AOA12_14890 [Microbacterium sp. No. 7]
MRVGIVGAGSIGLSTAADLLGRGHTITGLVDRDPDRVASLERSGVIRLDGRLGSGEIGLPPMGDDPGMLEGSALVIVATTADRHAEAAASLASAIGDGAPVLLTTGFVAGARCFAAAMRARDASLHPRVLELNTSPYLSYADARGRTHVAIRKTWFQLSAADRGALEGTAPLVEELYPQAERTCHGVAASLNNPNPVANASSFLLNAGFALREIAGEVEGRGAFSLADFGSAALDRLRDGLDEERIAVMRALGSAGEAITRAEFPRRAYGEGSRHPRVPRVGPTFQPRFFREDIPCGLAPVEALGESRGVATPVTSAFITLAEAVTGEPLRSTGEARARAAEALAALDEEER